MIEGINKDLLRRYVEIRHQINQGAKTIYAISSILAIFNRLNDDRLLMDPHALGQVVCRRGLPVSVQSVS